MILLSVLNSISTSNSALNLEEIHSSLCFSMAQLYLIFLFPSFPGLAVMNRLARNRFQRSEYDFEDRSINWDHVGM
jgi:hypothetical protein